MKLECKHHTYGVNYEFTNIFWKIIYSRIINLKLRLIKQIVKMTYQL